MAVIDPGAIEKILDEIKDTETAIQTEGDIGRRKKDDVQVDQVRNIVATDGEFDPEKWNNLPDHRRSELEQRLTQIRDSLQAISGQDGPIGRHHIMNPAYASTWSIAGLCALSVVLTAGLLYFAADNWDKANGPDLFRLTKEARQAVEALQVARDNVATAKKKLEIADIRASAANANAKAKEELITAQATERTARDDLSQAETNASVLSMKAIRSIKSGATEGAVLLMVIILGGLGSAVHMVGSLAKFVGNRQLKRSWLMYYMTMPVAGAALAPIVYMLLRVGVLSPTQANSEGSVISNLNLIAIYAFAAMTGLFAKTASDKLAEVFQTIFRTAHPAEKDTLAAKSGSDGSG